MMKKHRHAFNHVGISVTDLEKAIQFYKEVFGLKLIMGPEIIKADNTVIGQLCLDIFGEKMKEFRIAHMTTSDGIGIEIFEFVEPKATRRENNFEYWKTGIFHISFTASDLEEAGKLIEKHGGKVRSKIWENFPDRRLLYCEDPFGNIFELYDCTYSEMYANREEYR
jgi:catechol 2,3-dioxygenase-like lactoylglutathione lyase family enzyme